MYSFANISAHKSIDKTKPIQFYSLWTEPSGAIWEKDTPLKYFID